MSCPYKFPKNKEAEKMSCPYKFFWNTEAENEPFWSFTCLNLANDVLPRAKRFIFLAQDPTYNTHSIRHFNSIAK